MVHLPSSIGALRVAAYAGTLARGCSLCSRGTICAAALLTRQQQAPHPRVSPHLPPQLLPLFTPPPPPPSPLWSLSHTCACRPSPACAQSSAALCRAACASWSSPVAAWASPLSCITTGSSEGHSWSKLSEVCGSERASDTLASPERPRMSWLRRRGLADVLSRTSW